MIFFFYHKSIKQVFELKRNDFMLLIGEKIVGKSRISNISDKKNNRGQYMLITNNYALV